MRALDGICTALRSFDSLLRRAAQRAEKAFGLKPGEDPFRKLYVEREQIERVLERQTEPVDQDELAHWVQACVQDSLFRQLADRFTGLNEIDYAIVLLAFAPEFDSAYEWVLAYLQDDVTRQRATVELAASLFGDAARTTVLQRLAESAPLLQHRLIELNEPADNRGGVLSRVLRVDEQFSRWLLRIEGVDRRLGGAVALTESRRQRHTIAIPHATRTALEEWAKTSSSQSPLQVYVHGADAPTKKAVAEALGQQLALQLLTVDVTRLLATERPFAETARLLMREAEWFDRLLYFDNVDAFHGADRHREWDLLTAALTSHPGPVILSGTRALAPATPHAVWFFPLELSAPAADDRVLCWQDAIDALPVKRISASEIARLADRYVLTHAQIEQAALVAAAQARWRMATGTASEFAGPSYEDFAHAARLQGSQELETLTHRIVPKVTLNDLVAPAEVRQQLDEIVGRIQQRQWVLVEWGFGERQSYGNGVNALFAGPSGTGKTMAAEAIANELGKFLYKIDLPSVVSKYIGETEQRLERIFREAEANQAVLFFDEADSLLGKRSEVKDAHDRYANLEVSYLLQRMERYDGLILLATNLPGNLDDAFLRRMSVIVHFAPPGPPARRVLWEKVWPKQVPLSTQPGFALDYEFLARRFEITGGNIRNAALTAAFNAAERSWFRFVTMFDVLHGIQREFQKLGQALSDKELGLAQFKEPPAKPTKLYVPAPEPVPEDLTPILYRKEANQ